MLTVMKLMEMICKECRDDRAHKAHGLCEACYDRQRYWDSRKYPREQSHHISFAKGSVSRIFSNRRKLGIPVIMLLLISTAFAFDLNNLFSGAANSIENTTNTVQGQGIDSTTIIMVAVVILMLYMFKEKAFFILMLVVVFLILQWRGVL